MLVNPMLVTPMLAGCPPIKSDFEGWELQNNRSNVHAVFETT